MEQLIGGSLQYSEYIKNGEFFFVFEILELVNVFRTWSDWVETKNWTFSTKHRTTRDTDNSKFASLPYEPKFTRGLDNIFKNININLVYNSKNKLQTLLGNPKDNIDNNEKSGIYEISCKDCDQKYIGQTKRSILTRFKEHMAHLKYGRTEKSCVAQHAFDNNHRIDINNLKLIRNVTNSRQLDAFESLEIIKCNNSMNKDNGPIPTSPMFALINKRQLRFSEPWQQIWYE
ncbi:hypothetical protein NQ318_018939 [Aromia moschata]|uniref:GIY-YIG domain-containing protein n=1 Tax=Aromia moschata TaxID=1265417 RepID=A0AAV8ZIZ5_9CUCU|nr:hypothetical protein NQ318_018939 [Aromia moschata]